MNIISKLILSILILSSFVFSSEILGDKLAKSLKYKEEYYSTPAVGCCHGWYKWRHRVFEPIQQLKDYDSLPLQLRSNVEQFLDSTIGTEWSKILSFELTDISRRMTSQKNLDNSNDAFILYSLWFTFKTYDSVYYFNLQTDSLGNEIFIDKKEIITNNPKRIKSLITLWENAAKEGMLPVRARRLAEVSLQYDKKNDEFYWKANYHRGLSYLIGPMHSVKINAETGEVIKLK
jgi:hypothetical protein